MTDQTAQPEKTYFRQRFKAFESKNQLNHKIYRNRGVLKDAERFSLVDTVLDGEYNDFEIIGHRKTRRYLWIQPVKTQVSLTLNRFRKWIGGVLFHVVLLSGLLVYCIFHLRYKAD